MSTSPLVADPASGRAAWEPRTAFVLAGGAALGAMQAGMIHALYERGIVPDLLIGTSVGALNAAFPASRPATVATAEELAAIWRGLRRSDILPLRPATLISGLAGRRDHLIPDRALAAAVHAVTVLANARLQDGLACHAPPAELIVLPAVNPGHIPPTDFGRAGQLIRWALAAARTALAAGAPGPPTAAGSRRAGGRA